MAPDASAGAAPLLELRGIVKRFGEVEALAGVDLGLHAGEIHALLGENGAGKTTLVRIALGLTAPDAGAILLEGRPVRIASPAVAARLGLGMVHQHFALAPALTVAENLLLGEAPAMFTTRALERRAAEVLARHGVALDPSRRVRDLAVGEQQRLEIAKALERGGRVLILDEPTAVLAPDEASQLFVQLERLCQSGRAILLITHKLDEALAIASRVTVLRAGRVVLAATRADVDADALTHALFGEGVAAPPPRRAAPAGEVVLRVERLSGEGFGPVDLELRAGELVAIAGVDGNGQGPLLETLVGLRASSGGRIERPSAEAVAFVSGDRQSTGLALDLPIDENVAVKQGFLPRPWYTRRELAEATSPALERFDVRAASLSQRVGRLSGGNQQKVVLARELAHAPRLVLAENPTRGLDLRATAFVRAQLRAAVEQGAGALVATTELDEALELADRLFVIHRGRIHACEPTRDAIARRLAALARVDVTAHPQALRP